MRVTALLFVLGVLIVPGASAQSGSAKQSFLIVRDVSIGGFPRGGLVGQAVDIFGPPSGTTNAVYDRCTVVWRHLGLTMETYYSQGAVSPCSDTGRHVSTTVTDRRWRTSQGLRIGDSASKLRRLYPKASNQGKGEWWMIVRPFAGVELPGLSARVRNRRVVSLTLFGPRVAF
jgi:hypothetical protein